MSDSLRYWRLPSACFFLAFLRSPVTIGTTVAWMCGVCSSKCRTAETVFSCPKVQPLQVVGAPPVQPAFFLHSHQVFVRARQYDADCPYLVGRYLAPDASHANAVAYRFGAVGHTVGKFHQFTVEVGACGVGCARVRRAFRLVDLDAYISHACSVFFKFANRFVIVCLLRSCRMASGGVQRGATPLAYWGIFSGACTA